MIHLISLRVLPGALARPPSIITGGPVGILRAMRYPEPEEERIHMGDAPPDIGTYSPPTPYRVRRRALIGRLWPPLRRFWRRLTRGVAAPGRPRTPLPRPPCVRPRSDAARVDSERD